ncbi:hypothetical protein LV779_10885 [Streptomyces thinghirensis]|nr:hypothetical protein [Streptomyces thinghirensis]
MPPPRRPAPAPTPRQLTAGRKPAGHRPRPISVPPGQALVRRPRPRLLTAGRHPHAKAPALDPAGALSITGRSDAGRADLHTVLGSETAQVVELSQLHLDEELVPLVAGPGTGRSQSSVCAAEVLR